MFDVGSPIGKVRQECFYAATALHDISGAGHGTTCTHSTTYSHGNTCALPRAGHSVTQQRTFMQVVHPNSLQTGVVVGACIVCGRPHDDYGPRHRCPRCRMLVLVCPACAAASSAPPATAASPPTPQDGAQSRQQTDDAAGGGADSASQGEGDAAGGGVLCAICRVRQAAQRAQLPPSKQQVC